jgi:hypothetical protein
MGQYFRRSRHTARGRRHAHRRGGLVATISVAMLIQRYGKALGVSMAALA